MTYKARKEKRAQFFSLKAYLYKKAQLRALKLQFRQARRNAKKDGHVLTFDDYVASLQPQQEHVHGENCDHDHDEPIVVHEDELAQLPSETTV